MYPVRIPRFYYVRCEHTGMTQHYTDERGVTFEIALAEGKALAQVVSCPDGTDPWHKDIPTLGDLVRDQIRANLRKSGWTILEDCDGDPSFLTKDIPNFGANVHPDGSWSAVCFPFEDTEAPEPFIRTGAVSTEEEAKEEAEAAVEELAVLAITSLLTRSISEMGTPDLPLEDLLVESPEMPLASPPDDDASDG